jgi:hypothetical protein
MRLFFDYTSKDKSLYDYRGDEFKDFDTAFEFATEMAQHLALSLSDDWYGWSIVVRDAKGALLFTLPVAASKLRAA